MLLWSVSFRLGLSWLPKGPGSTNCCCLQQSFKSRHSVAQNLGGPRPWNSWERKTGEWVEEGALETARLGGVDL